MKQSIIITILILLLNVSFFSIGGYELIDQKAFLAAEVLRIIYKLTVYVWPMMIGIYLWNQKKLFKQLVGKFRWFTQYWVYVLWILYAIVMLVLKQYVDAHEAIYGIFYVLVVNSLIEEVVFRGYIQSLLTQNYGKFKWIVWQAVLFGLVHLPFYYSQYTVWLYNQMNEMIWWFLPIQGLGPLIIVFTLGTPMLLWLIRWVLTNKTNSLWPAIILHSIHNWILLLI
jgi:membrane protease YdiL (CAAX protease family)